MARPRKGQAEKRGDVLGVRLTAAERADLDQAAAAYGLTAAEFVRRRALNYRLPAGHAEARSTAVLATALMRLGVNFNQIAHHANAGRGLPVVGLNALIAQTASLLDRLYDPGPD